jgi:hypothetical protein
VSRGEMPGQQRGPGDVTLGQWRSTGASVIRLSGPSGDGPDAAGYLSDWGAYKRTWTLAEMLGSVGSVSVSVSKCK